MRALVTGSASIAGVLLRRAEAHPDAPFLIFDSPGVQVTRSYAEMADRARRAASLLRRLGVDRGDTLHVHLTNRPEFYDVWFGSALIGAVMAPTNPLLTADELAYVLTRTRCKVSITQPELVATVRAANGGVHELLVTGSSGPSNTSTPLEREIESSEGRLAAAKIDPHDVAAVLYTSGTTSRPKGVLVTHANYLHTGTVVAQHLRIRPDDRMLISLPLFHANAQYYSTMSAVVTGSSIVVMDRFSASRWAEVAAGSRATLASLFAAPIRMLLAQPERAVEKQNALRAVIFSQNLMQDQLADFERRFGAPLLQLYGMTETIAPPALNPLYGERRNLSIGLPTLGARLRIVDDDGREVPRGQVGELLVAGEPGSTLMAGYLDDEVATREAIVEGWLHTGDNVREDADGYLHFVDRAKDMIKRAGENVAASEVESAVSAHPAVFESAAIGIPDAMRDEAIKVYVVLADGAHVSAGELTAWCSDRLARFKVPNEIEFVDSLPRTSVGKVQKEVLKRREVEEVRRA